MHHSKDTNGACRPTEESAAGRYVRQLVASGHLPADEAEKLEAVARRYAIAITPTMLEQMDASIPDDPIGRQFLPTTAELQQDPGDLSDPVGDFSHSPLPGIVHRYPDRLLLMPLTMCPVYCRFCFRRETVGNGQQAMLSPAELAAALEYIRTREEVWEVILSGGDPLMLSIRRLQPILEALASISHVRVVRIHTRVPVVDPQRISAELIRVLRIPQTTYVVLHCNHARELGTAARDACAQLVDAGIPMLSQTVLLRGLNDNAGTLEALMRSLVEMRIKPYYLHQADKALGTSHFRTRIAEGQQLMRELRGRVSGLCQPEYVLDIPGGAGKVPAGPVWLHGDELSGYQVNDYTGSTHHYDSE